MEHLLNKETNGNRESEETIDIKLHIVKPYKTIWGFYLFFGHRDFSFEIHV